MAVLVGSGYLLVVCTEVNQDAVPYSETNFANNSVAFLIAILFSFMLMASFMFSSP